MARIIESPGVQISEIDLSLNASLPVGTNVLINGFTDQGPSQELLNVTSLAEYEQIYGVPTNAAERYTYHTMKNLLSTPSKVVFNRLPYGGGGGDGYNDKYTAMFYPAYSNSPTGSNLSGSGDYYIGTPTQVTINEDTYNEWKEGDISWNTTTSTWSATSVEGASTIGESAFVIINKIQTSVNQDFEGFYIGLSDNRKASTTSTTEDYEFNSIASILTSKGHDSSGTTEVDKWEELKDSRLNFDLTGNISDQPDSISEAVETIPSWDFGANQYNDGLIIGLYKLRRSGYAQEQNALQFVQYEGYVGSLGKDRKYTDPKGFQETSFFMENLVNEKSAFMDILVNPNLSKGNWVDDTGSPNRNIRIIDNTIMQVLNDAQSVPSIEVISDTALSGDYAVDVMIDGRPSYIDGTNVVHWDETNSRWALTENGTVRFVLYTDTYHPPKNTAWFKVHFSGELEIAYDSIIDIEDEMRSDSAFTLGLYQEKVNEVKEIGDVSNKLKLGLRLAEDYEVIPLDLVLDAGLSTIHTTMKLSPSETEFYDVKPVVISSLSDPLTGAESPVALAWLTIFNQFDIFCRDTRKDCMFIADVYRNILVAGKDYKTLTDKTKNFSQDIYTPLKNLTAGCNSSYSATYAQWVKVYDGQSSDYSWIPYSGFQGAIMSRLDSILYSWSAPAGLENGLVVGGLDLALASTQKQRDLLYRNNLNAVVFFPSDGMVCWGQKTLQKKPSAFDRINVRRLFLTLEKSTRSLMKYFVFQPNTTFTRTRVVNILTPVFDVAKKNEGVYDYLIVCDERNNTSAVIDNNELQVDIYLKPVRTAEFILVNFYATRTDQNFSELI